MTAGPARPDQRVLVVHSRYRSTLPSGENLVVDREVELLVGAGVPVERHERSSDEIATWSAARKAALPARVIWSPAERRAVRAAIRRFAPTVVHIHNTFPLLSPSVLAGCADEGVPVVMTLHNFRLTCANGMLVRDGAPCEACVGRTPLPAIRYACYRGSRAATLPVASLIGAHRALRTHARYVAVFVVLTAFARRLMGRAGLPTDRIVVKPNFVPEPQHVRAGPGRYLLFAGRLEREKGFDLVLEAWRGLGTERGRLVVVGDGALRAEAEAAAAADPSVRYLGRCPPERVVELLADARALLLPSRWYECLPLSLLEAFAAGVPAVVPDHGPFPEVTGEIQETGGTEVTGEPGGPRGQTALRIPPGDPRALAGAMSRLLADDRLAVTLGRQARAAYEARYRPAHNLTQLMAVYRNATRSGNDS